ncbi:S-adenosyl-L-methionine-dependent methyltransferase [Sodiomyces alkalinus F11]|uniref:S-adenosyl-L-methionine-dependent methyltransferase n=1 Tax=Sodiomyces alkalinus (strain CBS 110278 / VKM F-3762 / F11) TaxID=1314773 RepID=A0A3N2PNX9_SODAK|nr:S-adenosyl-L-methionine-dependent methyltransferase [Sodiomyces alkalinus F11]ROT36134.1 S-adenosyl-L-methionine-dependent methyltransferase [Sodiomyces alkalinus F11]
MSLPSKEEIDQLVTSLNQAAGAYSDGADLDGYLSRVQIIAKARELTRALITPDQMPNYHGLNIAELIAIRAFMRLKVLDAIPTTGSISLGDLSKATGVQESLLERMGRVLVAAGFLDQTEPDGGEYKHTKFSLAYILDKPAPGHLFLAMYDEWFKHMHDFDDYLIAKGEYKEPDDPLHNPYTAYYKQEGTPVWAIMMQHPERLKTFQTGMTGLDVAIPVVGHFDFSTLANTPEENDRGVVELIDVGGGEGVVLNKILDAHPELSPKNCMLQERGEAIRLAKDHGTLPPEVRLLEHDFMTPQPVKGAKAYFMRMILHDYADDVGIQILTQLAQSMSPQSRVLVCEMVLSPRVGEVDFASAVLDQAVMTMGGKERTEAGFRKMFEAAGLELVAVWRVPGVPGGCVEGRLKSA